MLIFCPEYICFLWEREAKSYFVILKISLLKEYQVPIERESGHLYGKMKYIWVFYLLANIWYSSSHYIWLKNRILDASILAISKRIHFRWWTVSFIEIYNNLFNLPPTLCIAISMRSINTIVTHTINFKDWTCSFLWTVFLDSYFVLSYIKSELSQFYYYVLIPHSHNKIISAHEKQFSGNIIMTGSVMHLYL